MGNAQPNADPLVSVVVPTYKEGPNLPHLVPAISKAMRAAGLAHEIIIVDDDSRDGSEQAVAELRRGDYPVRLIVRKNRRDLASAAVEGFRQSKGRLLVCMDGDLSHPPELIPALVNELSDPSVDLAIGSRYVRGAGNPENGGLTRRLKSRAASLLARLLTKVSDPMAGFFAIRREVLARAARLSPVGFKIALELIVRCNCRNIREVPIEFRKRLHGSSKMGLRQQFDYLRHLTRLLVFRYLPALTR